MTKVFFQQPNEYQFEDLYIGQRITFPDNTSVYCEEGITITREMQNAFMRLTGNVQQSHTQGDLVYGMLTASFYSTLAGVFLPGKFAMCQDMKITFNKPVYIGDALQISGEITELSEATRRITVKAEIRNQHGERVSKCVLGIGVTEQ